MEEGHEDEVVAQLVAAAMLPVFRRRVTLDDPGAIVGAFTEQVVVHAGDDLPSAAYLAVLADIPELEPPTRGAGRARRRRVAGPDGQRPRVPAGGAAPHQAAEQGRLGRPGPLPGAQVGARR